MEIKYAFICRDANRSGHLINALAISVDDRVAVPTLPVNLRFHLVIVFRAAKSEVGEHSLRLQFLDNENGKVISVVKGEEAPFEVYTSSAVSPDIVSVYKR